MKTSIEMIDLKKAVSEFVSEANREGYKVDISTINYELLLSDVKEENEEANFESVLEILNELNDSVDLLTYGIIISLP